MFILKKIIGHILNPLSIYLILSIIGVYRVWRQKSGKTGKLLISFCLLLFIVLGYGLVFRGIGWKLERKYPPLNENTGLVGVKWVVVLGGGMCSDPSVPVTSQLTMGSQIRTIEGVRLWRAIKGSKLLFSGGAVFNTITEASGMSGLAKEIGVPDTAIILEDKSLDTDDQARFIKAMVKQDTILLVTSAAHMLRSVLLFRKAGIAFIAAPTNHLVLNGPKFKPNDLFPNAGNFMLAEIVCHEYLGLFWAKLRGKI
jgi:uncharacterized SAM-binding protein YcdF (DUF218 family)